MIFKIFGSILFTQMFDMIRDLKCFSKYNCGCSVLLSNNQNNILDANWKLVLLSYNYPFTYGWLCKNLYL